MAHQEEVGREHSGVPQVWSVLLAPHALQTVEGVTACHMILFSVTSLFYLTFL